MKKDNKETEKKQLTTPSTSDWVACKDKMPPNDSLCIIYRSRLKAVDYAYYNKGFEFPYSYLGKIKKRVNIKMLRIGNHYLSHLDYKVII